MGKIGLCRFHQVRDQVVPALQLNVNLGKPVLELVTEGNQTVVDKDQVENNDGNDNQADNGGSHGNSSG